MGSGDEYFRVKTPLGVTIRTTKEYWEQIAKIKHPSITEHESEVKEALKNPDEIRKSRKDAKVYLYYKRIGKLNVFVVTEHAGGSEGYIITAYLTDRIKEGEQIYVKS